MMSSVKKSFEHSKSGASKGRTDQKTVKDRKIKQKDIRMADHRSIKKLMAVSETKPDLKMVESKDGVLVSPTKGLGESKAFARTLLGNRPVFTKLIQDYAVVNGAAGSALATTMTADVTQSSGFSSWLNLFDEMRCLSVKARWLVYQSAPTITGNSNGNALWAVNFDPDQSGNPGSIAAVLTAARTSGPASGYTMTGGSLPTPQYANISQNVVPKGHYEMESGKLNPMLPPNSGGAINVGPVGGSWISTSTTAATVGYYKFYGEAITANIAWGIRFFLEYTMEFRFRG